MPLHATAHPATLDDRESSTICAPGGTPGWLSYAVSRFLPPPNSAVAARPGPAEPHWYETPGALRGF
jgi:hypothetical protein